MKFLRVLPINMSVLILAGLLLGFARSNVYPSLAFNADRVWGTKPVLEYFLLTAGLAEELQEDLDLSDMQFQALVAIASQEAEQLRDHQAESQAVLSNPALSLTEKRAWVAEIDYNFRITNIMSNSQQEIAQVLDEATYSRLVNWIENRWEEERLLRRNVQSAGGARSYTIYATRYDSQGAYTVAIPDKCIKFANGGALACDGYEIGKSYAVKIQYESNSVKVIVGEAGPWNVDDNFWATVGDPQPRRLFTDLPLGMPEAQAAYFDDYNGGLDQFGRKVTSPVAIDLSKAVNADLGLGEHQNAWLTVTFLWTEGWLDRAVEAVTMDVPTQLNPAYSGDMCGSSWHKIAGFNGNPAYLTLNVANDSQSSNSAEWYPQLPVAGSYKVEAFIPDHPPLKWQCPQLDIPRDTTNARYTIFHANGKTEVTGDQRPLANQWLNLGTYSFNTTGGAVKLVDMTGEESLTRSVSFSAMRFILQDPPSGTAPAPTPVVTAAPTPTPEPLDPVIWLGMASTDPGIGVTVPVGTQNLTEPGLGAATLDILYDPAVIIPTACQVNLSGSFDSGDCSLSYEQDHVFPDRIRLSVSSLQGVAGDSTLLASLSFKPVGTAGEYSTLGIEPVSFSDPNGVHIPAVKSAGTICISPCRNIAFMPIMPKLFDLAP